MSRQITVKFENQPDPSKLLTALAECYALTLERQYGCKCSVTIETEAGGWKVEPMRDDGLRAS